jgi:hypothetical protein
LYTELQVMPTMIFIKADGLDGCKADLGKVDVEFYVKDRAGFWRLWKARSRILDWSTGLRLQ